MKQLFQYANKHHIILNINENDNGNYPLLNAIKNKEYDIGKGVSDEFPEVKLNYDGEDLASDVIVLKGGFMNIGRNDIDGLKGESDIKLILPEECNVKAFTISPSVEELIVSINKDKEKDNILNFGISDVFKTDEYFKYKAIIETTKEIKNLHDELKFQHRILNTDKIRNTYIGMQSKLKRKNFYKFIMVIYIIMSLLLIVFSLYQEMDFKIYNNTTNKEVKVNIDSQSDLYVSEGIFIPFITGTKVSTMDFDENYKIVPITEFKWNNATLILKIMELIGSLILIGLIYYLLWGGNSHIIKVIRENDKTQQIKK